MALAMLVTDCFRSPIEIVPFVCLPVLNSRFFIAYVNFFRTLRIGHTLRRLGFGSGLWRVRRNEQFDAAVRTFHNAFADNFAYAAAIGTFVAADARRVLGIKRRVLPINVSAE